MAKYSNTKAKINEKIATNGAQAINGGILNDVLQTMVDSLGADYQYGGLVLPGSSFTAGEQPVVFLATTPGTYTNFGGLVVADGEVALLVWSGSAWSKQTPDIATRTEVSQLGQQVIYDVTANNDGATFASLSALLSSENLSTLIPIVVRRGGMSIRFVQSSDNKYVQYRCIANEFTTDVNYWGIIGENVYINNQEWLKVVTTSNNKILYGIKADGDFFFGAGVPSQVKEYVLAHKAEIEVELSTKVDKETGKSLINADFANSQDVIQTLDYRQARTDEDGKVLEGITSDWKKQINIPIETPSCESTSISNEEWLKVSTDKNNKIIEGVTKDGKKHISEFNDYTRALIKGITTDFSKKINIPVLDDSFISPVVCDITGTKGSDTAKYVFKLPLDKTAFNIRFRFRVTENLVNQNKTAVIAKLNDINAVTVAGVSMSQMTTTTTYQGQEKTNYWMCLKGGMRLNNSLVSYDSYNHHTGLMAFSVKYTGEEDNVTIENNGTSLIIKIGSTTNTFTFEDYPTVSELYEAIKLLNDIEVQYRELNNRNSSELAIFTESKLKSVMYTGVTGQSDAPIVEYTDAAEFMIPYAVDNTWHKVEIVKIGNIIYCSCDGILTQLNAIIGDITSLTLGGNCGVLFKDFQVYNNSTYDAEIVEGLLISSFNPYILIYEGHGIDKVPSVEATVADNMNTTTDRMQYVFSELRGKGYEPVSVYDIVAYYDGIKELPKRCYTLIFDDFRFDNVMDIENREVFTRFNVKPALAVISNNMGTVNIEHDGGTITPEQALTICKLHNFDLVSHTKNHRDNSNIKPSETLGLLASDNYTGEIYGVDGAILVFPYGGTSPYLFRAMEWLGYKLGVNVWSGNYNNANNYNSSKYNLRRFEIGMRMSLTTIINGIK